MVVVLLVVGARCRGPTYSKNRIFTVLKGLLVKLVRPGAALAVSYGYAETAGAETVASCVGSSAVPCPSGDVQIQGIFVPGFNFFSVFRGTLTPSGGYIRFAIPYDALSIANASHSCVASPFSSVGGQALFNQLIYNIQGAQQLGLEPDITFEQSNGTGGVTPEPDPGMGSGSSPFTTLSQDGYNYRCGEGAILADVEGDIGSSVPIQFEAFNEPDAFHAYNGGQLGTMCGTSNYKTCSWLEQPVWRGH